MIFLQCFLGCLFAFGVFIVVLITLVLPYALGQIAKHPDVLKAFQRGANVPAEPDPSIDETEHARMTWKIEKARDKTWADGIDLALETLYRDSYLDGEARDHARAQLVQLMASNGYLYHLKQPSPSGIKLLALEFTKMLTPDQLSNLAKILRPGQVELIQAIEIALEIELSRERLESTPREHSA